MAPMCAFEIIAGLTTFLTMAYIIFKSNDSSFDAGMDHGAVFVRKLMPAAAIGCFIMGFVALTIQSLKLRVWV